MPRIRTLHLDGSFLQSLESGAVIRKRHIPTMDALKHLNLDKVGFHDLGQIQNVICLIGISPKLQSLVMRLEPDVKCWNGMLMVESWEHMVSSVTQYLHQFIKLLLASSPSLE